MSKQVQTIQQITAASADGLANILFEVLADALSYPAHGPVALAIGRRYSKQSYR